MDRMSLLALPLSALASMRGAALSLPCGRPDVATRLFILLLTLCFFLIFQVFIRIFFLFLLTLRLAGHFFRSFLSRLGSFGGHARLLLLAQLFLPLLHAQLVEIERALGVFHRVVLSLLNRLVQILFG